jgi:hypothetical protein
VAGELVSTAKASPAPNHEDEPTGALHAASQEDETRRSDTAASPSADVIENIRRLGELRSEGIISEQEFEQKKAELLSRI